MVLAILLLIAWAFTGLYRVDQAERGVVQRFGAYTVTTLPGLANTRPPITIERNAGLEPRLVCPYSDQRKGAA
jgi:membrane protease subunit HflK